MPVGNTPLWKPHKLQNKTGFSNLFVKDDSTNPTSSFKDRASYLVAAFAKQHSINKIVLASTGNAGSSMAGIGACADIKVTIFLPESAPEAKMVQAMQYGAEVILVKGNYDKAFELSLEYSKKYNGINRNTAYNPMTIEGKKSVSLELYQQLQTAPDYIFVPTGDGCILAGVYKGFRDLKEQKFINKIPIIYAVQAEGSNAIVRAFNNGNFDFKTSTTVADSICVDIPRNGFHALKQLKNHNGRCTTVSDRNILDAQKELASFSGIFTEPAGAASYAGFLKEKNNIPTDATVVLLATGSGLKDTASALKGINTKKIIIDTIQDYMELQND